MVSHLQLELATASKASGHALIQLTIVVNAKTRASAFMPKLVFRFIHF